MDRRAPAGGLAPAGVPAPADALVIGAGLAGSSVAHALASRGWQVRVVDAADHPAAGASSLPAGLFAPHLSADDGLLSRLSRHGLRATARHLPALHEGVDWQAGLLEHLLRGGARKAMAAWEAVNPRAGDTPVDTATGHLPGDDDTPTAITRTAPAEAVTQAGLPPGTPCAWHAQAGWIRPAALVRHWLAHPGIIWQGGTRVHALEPVEEEPARWQALDESGRPLAQAGLVVIAAALGSASLSQGHLRLQPVRGQVSWGLREPGLVLPPFPVNGHGHLLPDVPLPPFPPLAGLPPTGARAWLCGSTYGHGDDRDDAREADQAANLERLQALLPVAGDALAPAFTGGRVRAWTGVRCASTDRRPLVGPLAPGLWVSTAMGSRGLTFAALCADLLAARLHGEPLPLPADLADALDLARQRPEPLSAPRA